jgi:hypothetical protein
VYAYLFAKKDQANIADDELGASRKLAGLYAGKSEADLLKEMKAGELMEICCGNQAEI